MKQILVTLTFLFALSGFAQKANAPSHPSADASGDLETVLSLMDKAAPNFKSAEADFQQDQYTKIVNVKDVQNGKMYLRRNGKDLEAGMMVTSPISRQIVFKDGKVSIYDRKIDQITERDAGKNKADVESFMRLGFGERGHDLLKSYDVKMAGWETIDGIKTAKLELVPKSDKMRGMFSNIIWWIDPQQDLSVQQQMFEPSGDYRLVHYTNIKLNSKPSQDYFRIDKTSKTKIVRP
jgi:outer membrane lipoprotein-sorting protein